MKKKIKILQKQRCSVKSFQGGAVLSQEKCCLVQGFTCKNEPGRTHKVWMAHTGIQKMEATATAHPIPWAQDGKTTPS